MTYPLSSRLAEILDCSGQDASVDLRALADRLALTFAEGASTPAGLFPEVAGTMHQGTLSRHLFDAIVHDSVVRDILTTGHLGKLLSRLEVLKRTGDYRIVGLPNQLFDARSQAERAEFFGRGGFLIMDGNLLQ